MSDLASSERPPTPAPYALATRPEPTDAWSTPVIPFWQRLGVRLTLLMMTLVLLLAVATAVLVIRGFEETQRNAMMLTRDQLEARAKTELIALARRDAEVIAAELSHAQTLSQSVAVAVAATGTAQAIDDAVLEPLLRPHPDATLVVIDARGVVSTRYSRTDTPLPLSATRLLAQSAPDANTNRQSLWTFPNQAPARQALIVSSPIYSDDRFQGVVSLALPLRTLDTRLADLAPSEGSGVLLLNDRGNVVSATGGDNALSRLFDVRGSALLSELRQGERLLSLGPDGQPLDTTAAPLPNDRDPDVTLLVHTPVPQFGWSLAIATPLADLATPPIPIAQSVRQEASDTISATLINIVAAFLLTLIGATLFSRSFLAEPISALVRGAQELASGRLGVRISVTARSELGVLASTFNQMSQRLETRTNDLLAANDALKQSESRLELAMQGANDGLWEWDLVRGTLYLSPRWLAILGYQPGDIEPSMAAVDALTHPDDRTARRDQLDAHLTGDIPTYKSEHRMRHKHGGYRWVLVRGASLRNDRGEVVRMAGSLTDITDRVEAMALLERRVAERTSELSALLELTNQMAMTLELAPLVDLILETLQTVVDYDAAAIWQRYDDRLVLLQDSDPTTPAVADLEFAPTWSLAASPLRDVLRERRPLSIDDVYADTPLAHSFRATYRETFGELPSHLSSWMGVPLIARDQVIGMLTFEDHEVGYYTPARARLALAFANEVAIAIESAKLYEAAQDKAALEERQHLARELHDSVSQALYGIVLGAHTAKAQLGKLGSDDPSPVAGPLDYVVNLAQAGIAEMRALIFELRPESLEQEGLTAALRKQAESLKYRHQLELELDLADEPELPLAAKQTLYRIAQEALHNIVKHARAQQVRIDLRVDDTVQLTITDDGVGFDPSSEFPGHLGLVSMRERAEAADGHLHIDSAPGAGTTLRVELRHRHKDVA